MKEKNRVRNLDIEEKILQASDITRIADPEDERRPFSEDFFLGHKVISSRDCSNVKVFYLSLLRDLFYRSHDGVFLSISDIKKSTSVISSINSTLGSKCRITLSPFESIMS